jgi:hypothetical protein
MKKGDKLLALILVVVFIFAIGQYTFINISKTKRAIIIRSDGEIVQQIPLNETTEIITTIKSKEGAVTVQIKNGKVHIIESTCHDKLCVKQGWISRTGESIVCLPNRISISIVGEEKNEIDSITH